MGEKRREVVAYAITYAPPGVKGGPYEGAGALGQTVPKMALAYRYKYADGASPDAEWLRNNGHTARVIRIVVRAERPSPSGQEASAVEVLRALLPMIADPTCDTPGCPGCAAYARARRVLAGAGSDRGPGTLAHLRADLRDMTARAEKAERMHSEAEAQIACRNELRAALAQAERERDTLREQARASSDEARRTVHRLAGDLRDMTAQRDTLRVEVERLTGRATDEELLAIARAAYDQLEDVPWLDRIVRAVAARVREERAGGAAVAAALASVSDVEDPEENE